MSDVIPKDRPVRGTDFTAVERALGIRTTEMLFLLGVTAQAYYTLRRLSVTPHASMQGRQRPVLTQAIMLRLMCDNPDLLPIPKTPTAAELLKLCEEIDPSFTARHLAVLHGRDGTAGYKWLARTEGSPMRQEVERLMLLIWLKLTSTPPAQRKRVLQTIEDTVALEAQLRGYDITTLRTNFRYQVAKPPSSEPVPRRSGRNTAVKTKPKRKRSKPVE